MLYLLHIQWTGKKEDEEKAEERRKNAKLKLKKRFDDEYDETNEHFNHLKVKKSSAGVFRSIEPLWALR